jgi:SPX domain
LILLQNYQNLNHTGFRKILKKHDKLLRVDIGGKWQKEKVEASHFFTNRDIDKIINDTETVVTTELESGDRQRAMKRLRVPPLGEFEASNLKFLLISFNPQGNNNHRGQPSKSASSPEAFSSSSWL